MQQAVRSQPNLKSMAAQVSRLLCERGHLLLEEPKSPRAVQIQLKATVAVASLTFDQLIRRVVAKPIAPDAAIASAEELCRVQERIRAQNERLARAIPRLLGCDPNDQWYLMEFIEGPTLLALLAKTVNLGGPKGASCNALIEEAARTLHTLHQVTATDVGVWREPRLNNSYVPDFERLWMDPEVAPYVPANFQNPQRFYDYLSSSFGQRSGKFLLLSDVQPKNILVSKSSIVHFIDVDYSCGNPAIEVGQFLCALDRLRLRYPLALSAAQVSSWKRCFLAAYFEQAEPWVAEDLLFFYLWILLMSARQHIDERPWLRTFLLGYYGRRLRDFSANLLEFSPNHVRQNPVEVLTASNSPFKTGKARRTPAFGANTVLSRSVPIQPAQVAVTVPLLLDAVYPSSTGQPVTVGIPFPRGIVRDADGFRLVDESGNQVLLQTQPLARWSDGSVKWLLLDFVLDSASSPGSRWTLQTNGEKSRHAGAHNLRVQEFAKSVAINTEAAAFHIGQSQLPLSQVVINGKELLDPRSASIVLCDSKNRQRSPRVGPIAIESCGPVRATICLRGTFGAPLDCRFLLRLSFFTGTALARIDVTIHNPKRARHRYGLWDLGDPGSMLFRELSLQLGIADTGHPAATWQAEPDQAPLTTNRGFLEIYQDSSGGGNWDSNNHVNRNGQVPCSFRGYRVRADGQETVGLRASPLVTVRGGNGAVTVALPEFWQQFPKAIEVEDRLLRIALFPKQFGDLHELQGGEQKTHTLWLHFQSPDQPAAAWPTWVHQPARVRSTPDWYANAGVVPFLTPAPVAPDDRLGSLLGPVASGKQSFSARREIIDEYGWRNYGEIFADHELLYYKGPQPLVSHYNNQYDCVYGILIQYLRTGNPRWFDLLDPLARHVRDIDIYHTDRDKAAYNGGLFWHTDHYLSAATCTHRAFSRANCPAGQPYGGGPSTEHVYTSGLLHYYYLTGDPTMREAVLGLADWVLRRDDGRRNLLGILDDGPTGQVSSTDSSDFHGPGRGCGNSVNALLDAWLLTDQRRYLEKAESLICRSIHPADNIAARDLLNTEARWSYTVFLSVLWRYLRLKAEAGELDYMYAYAQASLIAYARWMLENEIPYFDHPEKLEFPTETWAAQDLRKANVVRLAAEHADEPLRTQLHRRGNELALRAWSDLLRFETRSVARAVALLLVEGPRDALLRSQVIEVAPRVQQKYDFGMPKHFLSQKQRIRSQAKLLRGMAQLAFRLLDIRRWWLVVARNSDPLKREHHPLSAWALADTRGQRR